MTKASMLKGLQTSGSRSPNPTTRSYGRGPRERLTAPLLRITRSQTEESARSSSIEIRSWQGRRLWKSLKNGLRTFRPYNHSSPPSWSTHHGLTKANMIRRDIAEHHLTQS